MDKLSGEIIGKAQSAGGVKAQEGYIKNEIKHYNEKTRKELSRLRKLASRSLPKSGADSPEGKRILKARRKTGVGEKGSPIGKGSGRVKGELPATPGLMTDPPTKFSTVQPAARRRGRNVHNAPATVNPSRAAIPTGFS